MTDLGYAANILHEALHCMMVSNYIYAQGDTSMLNALAREYGFLYNGLFTDPILKSVAESITPQHDLMLDRYQNVFATALYQFALAKNISITLEYCMDLAFWGAYDSQAFLTISDPNTKDRILSRIAAEQDPSGNIATQMGLPIIPSKGNPCP